MQQADSQQPVMQQMVSPYINGYPAQPISVQPFPVQPFPVQPFPIQQQVVEYEEEEEIPQGLIQVFRMINKLHSACVCYIVILDNLYSFDLPLHYTCWFASNHSIHLWSLLYIWFWFVYYSFCIHYSNLWISFTDYLRYRTFQVLCPLSCCYLHRCSIYLSVLNCLSIWCLSL